MNQVRKKNLHNFKWGFINEEHAVLVSNLAAVWTQSFFSFCLNGLGVGLFTSVDVSFQQFLHFLHDSISFMLMAPHSCDSRSLTVLAAPATLPQKKESQVCDFIFTFSPRDARVPAPSTVPAPLLAPGWASLTADPPVRAAATNARQSVLFLLFEVATMQIKA